MNGHHHLLVILASKGRVAALLKSNGEIVWSTRLPGGLMGISFITLTATESHVFAHSRGSVHCLDLLTGKVLWSNDLEGFGYGIASLCVPGAPAAASAPDAAVRAHLEAESAAAHSAPPA